MDYSQLLPGQDRCVYFQDEGGRRRLRYAYRSLHGALFHCVSASLEEAERRCEDWLLAQDRCYRN